MHPLRTSQMSTLDSDNQNQTAQPDSIKLAGRRGIEAARVIGRRLAIDAISHSYGSNAVLHDIEFAVAPGEIVALLGPSGSGKTTILRIIAGLVRQTKGRVLVDGLVIDSVPPERREMGLVFQNYALFPHLTVRENIAYGLIARRLRKNEIRQRVDEILELIRLTDVVGRLPRDLSGGQQQRVATGRALVTKPQVLLLDEPFGALDRSLRLDMQIEFLQIQRQFGITSLIVTHDQEEALSIADRVVVLNEGRIEQIGTPTEVYDHPRTLFVNSFVGTANSFAGTVIESTPVLIRVGLAAGLDIDIRPGIAAPSGATVCVTARPEHIAMSESPDRCSLPGTINAVLPIGPNLIYEVLLSDGIQIKLSQLRQTKQRMLHRGMKVFVILSQEHCHVFVDPAGQSSRRSERWR